MCEILGNKTYKIVSLKTTSLVAKPNRCSLFLWCSKNRTSVLKMNFQINSDLNEYNLSIQQNIIISVLLFIFVCLDSFHYLFIDNTVICTLLYCRQQQR